MSTTVLPYAPLTSVAMLRAWLKAKGSTDDSEISLLIQVASELIGRFCGRDNLGGVLSYVDNYFQTTWARSKPDFNLILRHYPIVSVTSVTMNGCVQSMLTQDQLQSNQSGIFIAEGDGETRILKFRYMVASYPITVVYTAGYAPGNTPMPLQQACVQFASEIYRSSDWIGVKSRAIAGETITYDTNGVWGMSNRVKLMLQPYRDIIPFRGY